MSLGTVKMSRATGAKELNHHQRTAGRRADQPRDPQQLLLRDLKLDQPRSPDHTRDPRHLQTRYNASSITQVVGPTV
ncbi:uncharacterized protein BDCG_17803 [Blastomyces dermatitidis ER-3]|uniref:Uncharacterized protein n=1 Tax=Ajellomyces dermatitidis (strain ER-3 / ATCC MYA-2586) TaxID=559297 RepID=A0ABX2W0D8_AJEDR|nr:uncharacterized protein BDCG_17803 [Blastomyces dermatitidis ER-3]OAT02850.1 hypothetical protein BDCG_17803 [Blastomyces dermatitidis ER-3]